MRESGDHDFYRRFPLITILCLGMQSTVYSVRDFLLCSLEMMMISVLTVSECEKPMS